MNKPHISPAISIGSKMQLIAAWYTLNWSWMYFFVLRSASLPFIIGICPASRDPEQTTRNQMKPPE